MSWTGGTSTNWVPETGAQPGRAAQRHATQRRSTLDGGGGKSAGTLQAAHQQGTAWASLIRLRMMCKVQSPGGLQG